jgi:hypothetical protein
MEATEQYQVEISNRFVCLENLNHNMDINGILERFRENITILPKKSRLLRIN